MLRGLEIFIPVEGGSWWFKDYNKGRTILTYSVNSRTKDRIVLLLGLSNKFLDKKPMLNPKQRISPFSFLRHCSDTANILECFSSLNGNWSPIDDWLLHAFSLKSSLMYSLIVFLCFIRKQLLHEILPLLTCMNHRIIKVTPQKISPSIYIIKVGLELLWHNWNLIQR